MTLEELTEEIQDLLDEANDTGLPANAFLVQPGDKMHAWAKNQGKIEALQAVLDLINSG